MVLIDGEAGAQCADARVYVAFDLAVALGDAGENVGDHVANVGEFSLAEAARGRRQKVLTYGLVNADIVANALREAPDLIMIGEVRTRAGKALDSPALIADGNHARADSYVSLAVLASAAFVALGLPVADPLIGLAITGGIFKITRDSWRTVRGHHH